MDILTERTTWTAEELSAVIAFCLTEPYRYCDNIRTAAMMAPYTLTPKQWAEACAPYGIKGATAKRCLAEVRKFQREVGEIK